VHGDLGRVADDDLVLILSNSGNTTEVNQLLPALQRRQVTVIAMTATADNDLARAADIVLPYGKHAEACHLNLAPSTSTTLMLALGDALCLVTARKRDFSAVDFAQHHPGGSLGLQLSQVQDIMRPLMDCRVADHHRTVRQVFVGSGATKRRAGAVLLVDDRGRLTGIFTDSDLARLLERQQDVALDQPICHVMTPAPYSIPVGSKTTQAVQMLAKHNISELPVVDEQGHAVGMVDITDVITLMPTEMGNPAGGRQGEARAHSRPGLRIFGGPETAG
jgi:arabinose-5-phosphate isomerase